MNEEIKAAAENLIEVFERSTKDMNNQSLNILISIDDLTDEEGATSDCMIVSRGSSKRSVDMMAICLGTKVKDRSEKDPSAFGKIKAIAWAAMISSKVDREIKKALSFDLKEE